VAKMPYPTSSIQSFRENDIGKYDIVLLWFCQV